MFTYSTSQKLETLEWLCLVSSMCMVPAIAGIFSPAESTFGLSQPEDSSMLMGLGGSRCVISCNALDAIGPPPDAILTIPPPPIPNFILDTLNLNRSDDGNCNFCHIFGSDEEYSITSTSMSTWILALICAIIVAVLGIAILILSFLKCKKWKVFPVADSCPILPENFLTNKHSTSSTSCKNLAPTKASKQKTKEEKSKNKYWKQEYNQENPSHAESSQYIIGNESDEQSSPGTPIYAELEVTPGKGYESEKVHNSDCSPYAVHTYVGLDKDTQIGHGCTLMNGGAYDNAAFMPSEGKKCPYINNAYLPKISRQSPGATIPQWSNSVPASPIPCYPHRSPSIQKTYSLGRKSVKTNSALLALAKVKVPKVNVPLPEGPLTPLPNTTVLPTNLSKSGGSVLEVVQKRPLPPIPLERVNNVNF